MRLVNLKPPVIGVPAPRPKRGSTLLAPAGVPPSVRLCDLRGPGDCYRSWRDDVGLVAISEERHTHAADPPSHSPSHLWSVSLFSQSDVSRHRGHYARACRVGEFAADADCARWFLCVPVARFYSRRGAPLVRDVRGRLPVVRAEGSQMVLINISPNTIGRANRRPAFRSTPGADS